MAVYKTLYGFYNIGCKDGKIISISAVDVGDILTDDAPCALTDRAFTELQEYFKGERRTFDLPLLMTGTDFQKSVWTELCKIPYGQTRSYRQIAEATGNPKAVRAVGMANHRNPLAIVVPCHRVIGSNGSLTGYAGGIDRKAALLKLEALNMKTGETNSYLSPETGLDNT